MHRALARENDARDKMLRFRVESRSFQRFPHLKPDCIVVAAFGDVDFDSFELRERSEVLLHPRSSVVADFHRRDGLASGFADIPPLRNSGHDHERMFRMDLPLVDVAKSPIVVSEFDKLRQRARRIPIMAGRSRQAGMQHADIEEARLRLRELGKQRVGRMLRAEADAVDRNPAAADLDRSFPAPEYMHVVGKRNEL